MSAANELPTWTIYERPRAPCDCGEFEVSVSAVDPDTCSCGHLRGEHDWLVGPCNAAKGGSVERPCDSCKGMGRIRVTTELFGAQFSRECLDCHGTGVLR